MSFDLLIYVPRLVSGAAKGIEGALAGLGQAARVSVEDAAGEPSIEIEFEPEGEAESYSLDFTEFDPDTVDDLSWASAAQRKLLRACKLEAMLSTSAGRADGAISHQILAAIAIMEACRGVLLDPQASASGLAPLADLAKAEPGVERGYFFDPVHARQWAAAVAAIDTASAAKAPPVKPATASPVLGMLRGLWERVVPASAPVGTSLRHRWDQLIARDLQYFEEQARSEQSLDEHSVGHALDLLAWRYESPLGSAIANRALRSLVPRVEAKAYERLFPNERETHRAWHVSRRKSDLFRAVAYAAVADAGRWDAQFLAEAADAYEEAVRTAKPWGGEPDEWNTHACALMRLAIGDHAGAVAILGIKRNFRGTKPFHDRLKLIAAEIDHGQGRLDPDGAGATTLREIYEVVRQPEADASAKEYGQNALNDLCYRRFEFGVLRERYLLGNTGTPDWKRLFTSLSA